MLLKDRKKFPNNTSDFEEVMVDTDLVKLYPEIVIVAYIPPHRRSIECLQKETSKILNSIITKDLPEEGEVADSEILQNYETNLL
jgi:hypothetical protein